MTSFFKEPRWESKRLRDSANGESCANCGQQDGTVVGAHGNEGIFGKGKGLKAHDCFLAYLCQLCHDYVDHRNPTDRTGVWGDTQADRRECFRRAMFVTWLRWARRGWVGPR